MILGSEKSKTQFQWQFNWKILLFVLFFLPVTISLAFWQLDRADEKHNLLETYKDRQSADPVTLKIIKKTYPDTSNESKRPDYVRVKVQGQYDNKSTLLLDNRVRNSRPGYDVISPFKTTGGQWILVNRGWIAADLDRRILPEISQIPAETTLVGYLYRSPGKQIMLGDDPWVKGESRIVIQSMDTELISKKLEIPFYDFSLRLDEKEPGALTTGWFIVNVQPGKHTGYAFQWSALAVALMILAIFANSNLGDVLNSRRS